MKISQFKRDLQRMGVQFENGTRHWILRFNGKTTLLKRHPSKDLSPSYIKKILSALGL